jgi:hypothetical protein
MRIASLVRVLLANNEWPSSARLLASHLPPVPPFRHSGKECQMRSDLTDETHGQDAQLRERHQDSLRDLILDAMRRTDAAAIAPSTPFLPPIPVRSLIWESDRHDAFTRLGRRCTDLAVIAAALHRGRLASSLRASLAARREIIR